MYVSAVSYDMLTEGYQSPQQYCALQQDHLCPAKALEKTLSASAVGPHMDC